MPGHPLPDLAAASRFYIPPLVRAVSPPYASPAWASYWKIVKLPGNHHRMKKMMTAPTQGRIAL